MTAAVSVLRQPLLTIVCPHCNGLTSLHSWSSESVGSAVLRSRHCARCQGRFTTVERPLDSDSLPVPPGCPRWALRAAAAFLRVATRRT